jgi:Flp pilus assembly protein TadD
MKTQLHRRRLIRSPGDRRRGGLGVVRSGTLALTALLAVATAACDSGVEETTTSRVRAAPGASGTAPVRSTPRPDADPASAPLRASSAGGQDSASAVGPVDWETAEAAWRGREYGRAAALFTAWSAERPGNAWGPYMVGLSLWKSGDLPGAEGALVQAVELDGEHRKAHLNLARVRLDAGRPADALEPALRAAELEPASPEAWRVLGRVHHERGSVDDAVGAYQTALFLDRNDAWSLNNLGLLYIQGGRFEDALGPLALAVEADSTLGVARNNLGIALERTGHHVLAGEAYRKAVELGEGGKAAVSLARVEGREDRPGVEPVTLAVLAARFEQALGGMEPGTPVAVQPREP